MFTRRGFLGTALASLLALAGVKRLEASPKALQTPPLKPQEELHDLFCRFRMPKSLLFLHVTSELGLVCEDVEFQFAHPYFGRGGGKLAIGKVLAPTWLMRGFVNERSQVVRPGPLYFQVGPHRIRLDAAVLTQIGCIVEANEMTIMENVHAMVLSLPKYADTKVTVVPKDSPVHFNAPGYEEIVIDHPDLLLQYTTAPTNYPR